MEKTNFSRKVFIVLNGLFLTLFCLSIALPLINIVATSLSTDKEVLTNNFILIPNQITFHYYTAIFKSNYLRGFINSLKVTVIGVSASMAMTLVMGYALSQRDLLGKKYVMNFILATMVLDGGLIPFYVLVKSLGMMGNYSALIVPSLISTYNLILVRNYMQSIPESLIESARLDGCSEINILIRIIIPVSIPIIAAVTLFYTVGYWNKYFDVVLFINDNKKYTMQLMLRELLFQQEASGATQGASVYNNFKMAVMMVTIIPVLILYPFIQKHFISGIMLGSVKG